MCYIIHSNVMISLEQFIVLRYMLSRNPVVLLQLVAQTKYHLEYF